MKILSALFDATLVPFSMARDILDISNTIEGRKSFTRQQIERVEEDLGA